MINKSFRYRLYPTKEQAQFFEKSFGCVRFLYNHFLDLRQYAYKEFGLSIGYNDTARLLVDLKQQIEYQWLNEVIAQSLQFALKRVDTAYQKFFKKQGKYPVFKSKADHQSFKIPQRFRIESNYLYIPKLKSGIFVIIDRPVEGRIVSITISKNKTNKYYASCQCECETPVKTIAPHFSIGLDLGITNLLTTNRGEQFPTLKTNQQDNKKLKFLHRQLSKKKKGSSKKKKAQLAMAQQYEKIGNYRDNTLHQITKQIIDENQVICIEDLAVKNMLKNHKLARVIQESSWGRLVQLLTYKAEWYGRQLVKVDRFFPSSKKCSYCQVVVEELPLSVREWECPNCHTQHQRDVNAATNILNEGLRILETKSGCGMQSDIKQKPEEAFSSACQDRFDIQEKSMSREISNDSS